MTGYQVYYVESKAFPLVVIGTTQYCYVRAIENILYNPSGRSTGAYANVMRQSNLTPWVVECTSLDLSQPDKLVVMEGMRHLLEGEAKGRVRRCSLLYIDDCVTSLSFLTESNKTKAIETFLHAQDKDAFLQKPTAIENIRSRGQTKRFEFPPPKHPQHGLKHRRLSKPPKKRASAEPRASAPRVDAASNEDAPNEDAASNQDAASNHDVTSSLKAIQAVCSSILGS